MTIRKTTISDFPKLQEIYAHARSEMIKNGNPNQWKNISPREELIINDIKNGDSYVVLFDEEIVGVFSLILGKDPTYEVIEGQWLNNEPYGTIHRIASLNKVKGVFDEAINFAFTKTKNLRIDTHKDNSIMKHLLKTRGFTYCGIIFLLNGEPREAYQKVLL